MTDQPTEQVQEPAATDWVPPSPEELERMGEQGFVLIDGCFRPRSRVAIVV